MKTGRQIDNRFQSDAGKYASYLETPEGRLRLDLAFSNLQNFLPTRQENKPLSALDLGCGTGATAIRLARLGYSVTLLDSSEAMLEIAQRASHEAGVSDRVMVRRSDAAKFSTLFSARSFDVVLSHNVLEYVDDPGTVLADAASLLRDSSSVLSVLVRNQAGEVLKAAIQAGDLAGAEDRLKSEWGQESLYGGKARLFTLEKLRNLMKAASLGIAGERGVRMVADYLPAKVSRSDEYDRIYDLERKLGSRAEFVGASRYIQIFARGTFT